MLNGIAPILLFQFFKATPSVEEAVSKIPIVSDLISKLSLPPIPLYLDEGLTGIYIQSESKSVEIETKIDMKTSGTDPAVNQKGLGSTVTFEAIASQGSLGITLMSAMSDLILKKVTAGEYSVTYMNKAIVLIGGLLQSVSIEPEANTTLYRIRVTLTIGKPADEPPVVQVQKDTSALPLSAGSVPGPVTGTAPAPLPPPPPPNFQLGGLG